MKCFIPAICEKVKYKGNPFPYLFLKEASMGGQLLILLQVHYLQMCMKEYGCCPKFKRGDNSTYTFTKRGGGGMYLVSAIPTKLPIEFL